MAAKILIAIGLLSLGATCLSANAMPGYSAELPKRDRFVTFQTFLQSTKASKYSDWADSSAKDQTAFNEMKNYILSIYNGVKTPAKITSFILDNQYADCIPIMQQPAVHLSKLKEVKNAPPPLKWDPPLPDPTAGRNDTVVFESQLTKGLKDAYGNKVSCSEGFIPIARLDLQRLTRYPTLEDYFWMPTIPMNDTRPAQKRDHLPGDSPNLIYASGDMLGHRSLYSGGSSVISVWSPRTSLTTSQQWYYSLSPLTSVEHSVA